MANELIVNASLPETRIALMEDGKIQELLIERASGKGIVGNIYKGRVTRVLPGMQAAFVDIGLEKAAFLYVDDVYVHSEIWDEEEGNAEIPLIQKRETPVVETVSEPNEGNVAEVALASSSEGELDAGTEIEPVVDEDFDLADAEPDFDPESEELENDDSELDEETDDDPIGKPEEMGPEPGSGGGDGGDGGGEDNSSDSIGNRLEQPSGTIAPDARPSESSASSTSGTADGEASEGSSRTPSLRRHRRGRRGSRFRRKGSQNENPEKSDQQYPENYHEQVADSGASSSDRSALVDEAGATGGEAEKPEGGRPGETPREVPLERRGSGGQGERSEFKAHRSRDRRIRSKTSTRSFGSQVNIQDLLKEGQEILVQVAKDPISTKGARLTCHISLPGRHLVCMPTIDHVGVSRRIERDDERRRLREYVEKNRPRNLGFIVRTASGKQQSEKRIKQDIDYLTRLWTEIKEKAASVTAPALVYEDLNSVLRAIRDWVTEDIDKVIVDSRYHYNEILRFVSHFMPALKQKVELYHGDIPIFDAYGISTELSRSLERKVWLKSGGSIVIDQAEALVAIDVNTGRYVGKKNLEDTILKTNLEAVQEIAYQLRLRNCGGIIILDLIDMEKEENKHRVYRALEEALLRDRARPSILKISELGLIEMTRKRTRDTIIRTLCESCSHCEGKGFIKSKQTVAYEVLREIEREGIERDVSKILVQAHPDVIDILAIDERETLDHLERRYRKLIYLQAVTDFHPEQFEVTADKKEKSERSKDFRSSESGESSDRNRNPRDRDRNRDRDRERDRERDRDRSRGGDHPTLLPIKKNPVPVPVPVEASPGNVQPVASPIVTADPSIKADSNAVSGQIPKTKAADDESFDEEDRLAFLRAQAAQDAALARLNAGVHPTTSRSPEGPREGNNGSNRRSRGRRGGKFRRGNDRRGPKSFQQGMKRHDVNREPNGHAPSAETATVITTAPSTTPSREGNGDGGTDHSQPPV